MSSGWSEIWANFPIKSFFSNLALQQKESQLLPVDEMISVGSTGIKLISSQPSVLQLKVQDRTWLLLAGNQSVKGNPAAIPEDLQGQESHLTPLVLLWSGRSLGVQWLDIFKPKVAIATASTVEEDTRQQLRQKQIQLYWTGRDGAIQWTPKEGFQATLEAVVRDTSLM